MEVNVCKMCKRSFVARNKRFVCDDCKEANEVLFRRIEEYLMMYPNSNAMQVAAGLDVPIEMIITYIDEGRLVFSRGEFKKLGE